MGKSLSELRSGSSRQFTTFDPVSRRTFHEDDAVVFVKRLAISFINPWDAGHLKPYWYASTAYWYQDCASPLPYMLPGSEQLMSMYRIRDVDHQSYP